MPKKLRRRVAPRRRRAVKRQSRMKRGGAKKLPFRQRLSKGVVIRSLTCPIPDWYEATWSTYVDGFIPAGSFALNNVGTVAAGQGISAFTIYPKSPFVQTFAAYTNAMNAYWNTPTGMTAQNCAYWKQMMNVSGTGIYNLFVPLSAQLQYELIVNTTTNTGNNVQADSINVAILPLTSSDAQYVQTNAGVNAIFDNSQAKIKTFRANENIGPLIANCDMPRLWGQTKSSMLQALVDYSGTYSTLPTNTCGFLVAYQTQLGAVTANATPFRCKLRIHGRLITPVQSGSSI